MTVTPGARRRQAPGSAAPAFAWGSAAGALLVQEEVGSLHSSAEEGCECALCRGFASLPAGVTWSWVTLAVLGESSMCFYWFGFGGKTVPRSTLPVILLL